MRDEEIFMGYVFGPFWWIIVIVMILAITAYMIVKLLHGGC